MASKSQDPVADPNLHTLISGPRLKLHPNFEKKVQHDPDPNSENAGFPDLDPRQMNTVWISVRVHCTIGGFNFKHFLEFQKDLTESDSYWQNNKVLLFA